MNRSAINWLVNPDGSSGFTWNVLIGCSPEHVGCKHCWAERLAATRLAHLPEYRGLSYVDDSGEGDGLPHWSGEVRFFPERLAEPLRRRKPSSIFPCDMSDLFHPKVTNEQIASVFGIMAATPQHRYFVLTKRARRMREWFEWREGFQLTMPIVEAEKHIAVGSREWERINKQLIRYRPSMPWPLPNVALVVSVSDQRTADELIPELLQTPAAMRGVSLEPMVGPVDLRYLQPGDPPTEINALEGTHGVLRPHGGTCAKLDWIACGGESWPNARPCHVEWIRSVVSQCAEVKVPCHVKQLGANAVESPLSPLLPHGEAMGVDEIDLRDRAGADPSEWPADLRVRQRPVGW